MLRGYLRVTTPKALVRLHAEHSRTLADTPLMWLRAKRAISLKNRAVRAQGAQGVSIMIGRLSVLVIGLAAGPLLAWGISAFQQTAMSYGPSQEPASAPERDAGAASKARGLAKLSPNAIEAAGIAAAEVEG